MRRARRHHRFLSAVAFALLALVTELLGRSLTHRFDIGKHVDTGRYATAEYYPFLLAVVKVGIALLLARLAWRFARAHAAARAGRRLLAAAGVRPGRAPRLRLELSPRLWLAAFGVTALFYLVQTDAEGLWSGHVQVFAPWLHTSALPIFALLAVVTAVIWSVVGGWLADYERFAEATIAHAQGHARRAALPRPRRAADARSAPRRLFGLAFESRPPPTLA